MEQALQTAGQILVEHGYLVVLVWIFFDQVGLPLPGIPVLVAAGAVAAGGPLDISLVIGVAVAACLAADVLWFYVGWRGGERAVASICRLSLEPDSCISTTRNVFARFGPATLVIAKFLPGVQTLAPASAGFVRAPLAGFIVLDLLGSVLFVAPFTLAGYYFHESLQALLTRLEAVSGGLGLLVVAVLGVYVIVKAVQWSVFFRGHRLRRIEPDTLAARLGGSEPVTVVDLRQRADFDIMPEVIPGALRIPIGEVGRRRDEIPLHHDVVLVCT